MVDDAGWGFYGFSLQDEIIDTALIGLVLGGCLQAGQDEDIEIGDVFVCDVALCVCIFDPVAAGIGAEEDNHVGGWELLADDPGDQL